MITNFKLFEDTSFTKRDNELSLATQFLEDNQPVSKENGFIECQYSIDDDMIVEFIFRWWVSDDDYEEFYKYLSYNRLLIYRETSTKEYYHIAIKLSEYKIKKYANLQELKMMSDKYNI